ncbi:MAG: energy transducer TonB [Gemmatimonadota bacterium]
MSPVERLQSLTRDRLRVDYRRWLLPSVAVSVAVHVLVLLFFVAPVERIEAERPGDIVVIEERLTVPPPPREPARPAEPVLAESEIDVEITIPETPLISATPNPPDLPEIVPDEGFGFDFRTVEPRCRENCSAQAIMEHIPDALRQAGLSCEIVLGIRVDTSGRVTDTEILSPSGVASCDRAVESWARTTRWTTAYNRDEPVAVWIAQPIEVRTE